MSPPKRKTFKQSSRDTLHLGLTAIEATLLFFPSSILKCNVSNNSHHNPVCGIERYLSPDPDTPPVNEGTIPIAGAHTLSKGGDLDPKWTRLKTSPSHTDSQLEGLRLQIFGGKYAGRKQSAVVEFLCPGKEERRSDEGRRRGQSRDAAADDEADDREGGENEVDSDEEEIKEEIEDGAGGTISFLSYGEVATDDKEDVLRLKWTTPHACEDAINKPETGGSSGAQWGFFTWFIVM